MRNKIFIFLIYLSIGIYLYLSNSLSVLEILSLIFSLHIGYLFLTALSKKFIYLEFIIFLASLQWLIAPLISYHIFNKYFKEAKIWDTYMKVSSDEYFSFVLPGTFLFWIGLMLPNIKNSHKQTISIINNCKSYLEPTYRGFVGVLLLIIGVVSLLIKPLIPSILDGILSFFHPLIFIGTLYIYFSKIKSKQIFLIFSIIVLVVQAIRAGTYGPLIFWTALILLVITIGQKTRISIKITVSVLGIFFIFLIQSIKSEYRDQTWNVGMVRKSDPSFFLDLIIDRLKNPQKIFELNRLFGMAVRANQGSLIARTMNYVPKHEPFANGETIFNAFFSSLIPRIIWPDKPQTGGKEMVVRFLGAPSNLEYSFNISPIGEAYVNFNKFGGIVFMLLYGLFYGIIFNRCLKLSQKTPTLILWMPLIFIGPVTSMETDVLSGVNSLIKGLIFVFLMYKIIKWSYGIKA